jgi:hypothetical protein
MIQMQDGSYVGTDHSRNMVAFDVSGGWRWAVWGYTPLMATADGGVIATSDWVSATVFDKNGGAIGWLPQVPVPNWKGQVYSGSAGVELDDSWVRLGAGYWSLLGGNPSGNGASAAMVTLAESVSIFKKIGRALAGGPNPPCSGVGNDKPKLGEVADSEADQTAARQYGDLHQSLLTFLGSLSGTSTCANFLTSKGIDLSKLVAAVRNQQPFDGLYSNISWSAAGIWTAADRQLPTWDNFSKTPVCNGFWYHSGDWNGTVAIAQVQPPASDVYIATQKDALKHLTQTAIFHETLHNLTGLSDPDLYRLLSDKKLCATCKTVLIDGVLVQNGCGGAH